MIRKDPYKDIGYFNTFISNQTKSIDRFKQVLDGCGDSEQEKVLIVLCNKYKDLIAAQFSANEDKLVISDSFSEYATYLIKKGFSSYSEFVDFLSLQIILDLPADSVISPKDYVDDLTCFFTNFLFKENEPITGKLYSSEYYKIFYDYCIGDVGFEELIKYVNNDWYFASRDFYWFNSHRSISNTYAGYWCYVASAVIRIKGDYNKIIESDKYIV